MPIQNQPYRIMYETEGHKYFKICTSNLETMRFVKSKLGNSKRITISRVISVWINKHKNIEKR